MCGIRVYLVASDDMDEDKEVGGGYEPAGLLEGDQDVVLYGAAEDVEPDDGDGEVAQGHHDVGDHGAPPHGLLRRPLRRRLDGGLDLQHHAVGRVGERHVPQRRHEPERLPRRG